MPKSKKGIVYLVGAGPGDPGLITVKGQQLLRHADVIIYDRLVNPRLLMDVASYAEKIYVGKASNCHTLPQSEINRLLVKYAKQGKRVVRLKGGDPFVFGRGAEEILELVKEGIKFEVVPGISSAIAVPAYAGVPVTHRGLTSSLGIFTGQEDPNKPDTLIAWDKIATGLGTLVFLMGVENLSNIVKTLIKYGRDPKTACCVIQWGTFPIQKTVQATLANIQREVEKKQITPPAVLVIGDVVRLRKKLSWFEKRPLFGKKFFIPIPEPSASRLSQLLEDYGGQCTVLPLVKIEPLSDYTPLDKVIQNIDNFHWLVFTSQNGVHFFKKRLDILGKDVRILAGVRIAAIGSATKSALEEMNLKVDIQPKSFTQEGLLEEFSKQNIKGKQILIIRAEQARELLPAGLRKKGNLVTVVSAYRTKEISILPSERKIIDQVEMICFTSSSCVKGFMKIFESNVKRKDFKIASIGPVTSCACRELGLDVTIEAKQYTLEGLVKAILRYYRKKR
ncbi:MAG: uroporphyrinogen-III C-methyltransferase [Candidatus Omnitrophica bacterium]|nr:uroporphyrinogen-III C-methyltransferase [Candidatus Omnitrophota bacterium]